MTHDDDFLLDLDELEELLREHEGPPEPSPSRRRFRRHRRVPTGRAVLVAAGALLLGSGLGFGLASSLTPSGDAAQTTGGLGFVPEPGWYVLRSRFEATPARPSFALASNVPLSPLDARMSRRADWSGYPAHVLGSLRADGIVIHASFALRGVHGPSDESFPHRMLPLRLRDASNLYPGGTPGRPLGRYEIRAAVGDHNVVVVVHFASLRPSRALTLAAQRQLDRLVVGSVDASSHVDERALPLFPSTDAASPSTAARRVVDRTFSCRPRSFGGVGDLDVYVTPPRTIGVTGTVPAHLIVRTGALDPHDSFVVVRPRVNHQPGWVSATGGGSPGVFASSRRCVPASARIALTSRGLAGLPILGYRELDCPVRGRVLVRVRSVLRAPAEWRRVDRSFVGARQPLVESKLSVRLPTGKPIAYMEHDAKGGTRLWFSATCS
jgi:hypothetical protein